MLSRLDHRILRPKLILTSLVTAVSFLTWPVHAQGPFATLETLVKPTKEDPDAQRAYMTHPRWAPRSRLIKQYPMWAKYLEDPQNGFLELFVRKDWATLSVFLDANLSPDLNRLLLDYLFESPGQGFRLALQVFIIANGSSDAQDYLRNEVFPHSELRYRDDLVSLLYFDERRDISQYSLLFATKDISPEYETFEKAHQISDLMKRREFIASRMYAIERANVCAGLFLNN